MTEIVLSVTGMSCASCVRHVESALFELDGVTDVSVSLTENRVRVRHDPARVSAADMIRVVNDAGYESRPLEV